MAGGSKRKSIWNALKGRTKGQSPKYEPLQEPIESQPSPSDIRPAVATGGEPRVAELTAQGLPDTSDSSRSRASDLQQSHLHSSFGKLKIADTFHRISSTTSQEPAELHPPAAGPEALFGRRYSAILHSPNMLVPPEPSQGVAEQTKSTQTEPVGTHPPIQTTSAIPVQTRSLNSSYAQVQERTNSPSYNQPTQPLFKRPEGARRMYIPEQPASKLGAEGQDAAARAIRQTMTVGLHPSTAGNLLQYVQKGIASGVPYDPVMDLLLEPVQSQVPRSGYVANQSKTPARTEVKKRELVLLERERRPYQKSESELKKPHSKIETDKMTLMGLPSELRLCIWDYLLTEPQVLEINADDPWLRSGLLFRNASTGQCLMARLTHETRALALRSIELVLGQNGFRPYDASKTRLGKNEFFFNPNKDILYFNHKAFERRERIVAHLGTCGCLDHVRQLAVEHCCGLRGSHGDILSSVTFIKANFPNLMTLYVFVPQRIDDENERYFEPYFDTLWDIKELKDVPEDHVFLGNSAYRTWGSLREALLAHVVKFTWSLGPPVIAAKFIVRSVFV